MKAQRVNPGGEGVREDGARCRDISCKSPQLSLPRGDFSRSSQKSASQVEVKHRTLQLRSPLSLESHPYLGVPFAHVAGHGKRESCKTREGRKKE